MTTEEIRIGIISIFIAGFLWFGKDEFQQSLVCVIRVPKSTRKVITTEESGQAVIYPA